MDCYLTKQENCCLCKGKNIKIENHINIFREHGRPLTKMSTKTMFVLLRKGQTLLSWNEYSINRKNTRNVEEQIYFNTIFTERIQEMLRDKHF